MGSSSSKKALLEKNKKWVMARMGCLTAAANTVSPETQVYFVLIFILYHFITNQDLGSEC